jgi:type IV pilus assembly protein PilV
MRQPRTRARAQRGLSLLEALIALVILAFGILGMVGLHARLLAASTDAQHRVLAVGLADRLLSHAVVDPAHAACYAVPAAVACPSAAAASAAAQWQLDVAALPEGAASAALITVPMTGSAYTGANQQLSVLVQWQGKTGELHRVEATTDVR